MCTNYWTIKNLSNNVIIYSKRPQFKIKFSMFISFLKSYCYRIIVRDCNGKVKVSINGDATANWAKFKKCTQCVFLIKLYHPLSWDRDVVSDVFRWKIFFWNFMLRYVDCVMLQVNVIPERSKDMEKKK